MDEKVAEDVAAVRAYVAAKFGGDQKAAFDYYAQNGAVDSGDIRQALSDASVGNMVSRRIAAALAINTYGTDGLITWTQAQAAIAQIPK